VAMHSNIAAAPAVFLTKHNSDGAGMDKSTSSMQEGCSLATAKCNDYVRQDAGELKNDSLKLRTTCKTCR
jgi:hypothetical protein